ncbi:putative nucleic-acid-binding protein containing a Zn-ribbon [Desulfosporosinus orientis DSM 765]|uniref:Putative nucleic-acid-binding protein containing a Zn-ribbon n=1 Tax=Desulfosporosinus orientis (strain ATCC 19365 / DSM 765 / NCIMB 8382 / VKM B-1628 / Singapore I) TaxID=768706 RepID=G7WGT0_DESOD|nr:OB-fold domain-containing protein [Desulfosporosinus orientis]AET68516.1 putative nucleic-acid-binding protein containing a Zn-ribbon [Desulfosporosinus orientis DSM 765]
MSEKNQIPIDPDLFEWPTSQPELLGSKCSECGNVAFPVVNMCPKCRSTAIVRTGLKTKGTLWTWTSQMFRPKNLVDNLDPESYKPFYVGYVELADEVRVQTRLLVEDSSQLKIGMPMELEIIKLREESDGTEVMTYGFKPAAC